MGEISINREAMRLVRKILANAAAMGVQIRQLANGSILIDMGQQAPGSWLAGRYYAEITMGGLGRLSFETFPEPIQGVRLPAIRVQTDFPNLACTASQIAGWRLAVPDAAPILSGPARALNREPDPHFRRLPYRDDHHEAVIAIQTNAEIRSSWAAQIAAQCGVKPQDLYILVAPNNSLVCAIQVAARSVEQAIHRLDEEGLPLQSILSAHGFAVLPPLVDDDLTAMGRINDALLYGAEASFYLRHEDDFLSRLAPAVISERSAGYGRPFKDIFREAAFDFYNIPLDLHSPAVIHLHNLSSGKTFSAGTIHAQLLARSFFIEEGSDENI